MSDVQEEKFKGSVDVDQVLIKNKPAYLDVYEVKFDGNLLFVEGMINRGGKTKDVTWAYRRIKG